MTTAKVQPNAITDAPLTEKAREMLHESVDAMAERAMRAEDSVRNTADRSAKSLHETQDKIVEQWNGSKVKRFTSENPVATVGIAFAAGVLLTTLLRSRK